jgi:gluconolactonase
VLATEGPAVDSAGNVYFCDGNRIMKQALDGSRSVFREPSNRTNGLVFDVQGRLLAAEMGDKTGTPPRATRINIETGKYEVLVDQYEGKSLNSPNDITVDGKGRIYFTDSGYKSADAKIGASAVYRIDPDGKVTRILAAPAVQTPNGVIVAPDDRTLYLVESNAEENGSRMIRAYDLRPDGSVANMRVFHNFYPGRSADGMCIDVEGNLYLAAGLNRLRKTSETLDTKPGIHIYSPSGSLLRFIPISQDLITNCAFGGPDMKKLYVTAGKDLLEFPNEVQGTRR